MHARRPATTRDDPPSVFPSDSDHDAMHTQHTGWMAKQQAGNVCVSTTSRESCYKQTPGDEAAALYQISTILYYYYYYWLTN
jgi:hypothetical protein